MSTSKQTRVHADGTVDNINEPGEAAVLTDGRRVLVLGDANLGVADIDGERYGLYVSDGLRKSLAWAVEQLNKAETVRNHPMPMEESDNATE